MIFNEIERLQCRTCLEKLRKTKLICLKSIEYLVEQQRQIDECIRDLKSTQAEAQAMNENISQLNEFSCFQICFRWNRNVETSIIKNSIDQNQLLILPFPTENSNFVWNQLENDLNFNELTRLVNNGSIEFSNSDEFEEILHEQYTILFCLAKKLTKSIQILHDTIELLGNDVRTTLEHMQTAQPRMRELLNVKVPFAFAEIE